MHGVADAIYVLNPAPAKFTVAPVGPDVGERTNSGTTVTADIVVTESLAGDPVTWILLAPNGEFEPITKLAVRLPVRPLTIQENGPISNVPVVTAIAHPPSEGLNPVPEIVTVVPAAGWRTRDWRAPHW